MTTQSHNPFATRRPYDRYELMLVNAQGEISYAHCTSFRQTSDGRVLLERRTSGQKGGMATNPRNTPQRLILRIRDFLTNA
jgi:hypothetical protein